MQKQIQLRWSVLVAFGGLSLALGAALSAVTRVEDLIPVFWIGWLGYSVLLAIGFAALYATWRWAGSSRGLAWIMALAFALRLVLGVGLYTVLPVQPQNERDRGGYIFIDAFVRDQHAWELARYHQPFWTAFRQDFVGDQYGGLASVSTMMYEAFSPDAHRPLLIVTLGALVAALGLPFFWKAMRGRWGNGVALPAAWILALYPESVVLGASQMREPFLVSVCAILFWGMLAWLDGKKQVGPALAVVLGFLGLVLLSLPVAVAALAFLGIWFWLEKLSAGRRKIWQTLGWVIIVVGSVGMLIFFAGWLQTSAIWEFDKEVKNSGLVQGFSKYLGEEGMDIFLTFKGLSQPVLPAAVADPSLIWIKTLVNIFLAAGWYALAPLLLYSTISVWKETDPKMRWVLAWSVLFGWVWILISSYRAGGDQWDNPRYREIFLVWLALLAGWGWNWARTHRDAWLYRWLGVEGIFLALFSLWYANRTLKLGLVLGFWHVALAVTLLSALVLLGGWLADRRGKSSRLPS